MKTNNTLSLLKLEFLSTMGSFFTPLFGILLPTFMAIILVSTIPNQVPAESVKEVTTSIILTMATMIPLSIMLVSFPSLFAQEVEQKILFRLELFQIPEKRILFVKIIINVLIMTLSFLVYAITLYLYKGNDFILPSASSLLIYIGTLYLLATIYFIFAFSIAKIFQKFGSTYSIAMFCYFMTMFFSGMMGAQPENLPGVLRTISKFFPTSFITSDFVKYWKPGFSGYNFAPFIQSLIFWIALAGIAFFISLYKNRKRV